MHKRGGATPTPLKRDINTHISKANAKKTVMQKTKIRIEAIVQLPACLNSSHSKQLQELGGRQFYSIFFFSDGCTGINLHGQKLEQVSLNYVAVRTPLSQSLRLPDSSYWVGFGDVSVLFYHCVSATPRLWSTSPCCFSHWALVRHTEQKVIPTCRILVDVAEAP